MPRVPVGCRCLVSGACGDGRENIFRAVGDRRLFFDVLAGVWERFNWVIHAYCLMTNHYHLLVETPDGNLAKGMRELNGLYTQRFNRVYGWTGHVCQGRYKAILVQKEAYLLEVPCITLRDETEWVETVEDGWNLLVGPEREKIVEAARCFEPVHEPRDLFGKGDASIKIVDLVERLCA